MLARVPTASLASCGTVWVPLVDFHAGTERGRDALGEVEVQVPRLDVFEDVRDVHGRATAEVPVRPLIRVARQRLEVRDPGWAEPGLLRRGEAKEELGRLGDELRTGHACGEGHALGQARPAGEAAAGEAAADARQLEDVARRLEDRLVGLADQVLAVAAEEERDVVLLEDHVLGVAREAKRVDDREHRLVCSL